MFIFSIRILVFLSITAKKVNQIRNKIVCVVARLVFVFSCALTMGRCNAFQHISVNQQKMEVLRSIFPDYVISCDYGLLFSGNPKETHTNGSIL